MSSPVRTVVSHPRQCTKLKLNRELCGRNSRQCVRVQRLPATSCGNEKFQGHFGHRLRAAGVGFEDRQDLLGHCSGRITTHYSAAELSRLLEAVNRVCERGGKRPELLVLRRLSTCESRKIHARKSAVTVQRL